MKIITDKNQLKIDDEFISICREIVSENKTDDEWSEIESSDMFQTKKYCGGYESAEQEFCFSYYDTKGKEWWFQVNLPDISEISKGELKYLDLNEPF